MGTDEENKKYKFDEEELYDSNGNEINYHDEDEDESQSVQDKIFGNAFNSGETDFKELPDIKAESDFAARHLAHVYDSEEYHMQLKLSKMCAEAFADSQWATLPADKKFPKELMPYIFNDLFKALDVDGHSVFDIFIAIGEFMDGAYDKVYAAAGFKVKSRLIAECNQRFGSLDNKDMNRLF